MKYRKSNPVLRTLLDDEWGTSLFDNTLYNKKWTPAVNVKEMEDKYNLEFVLPGFDKEDIKIEAEKGVLTVSSEKKSEESKQEENYTRREYTFSSFSRSFTLPENVEVDKIDARFEKGMLYIDIAKVQKEEDKKLEIAIK